MQTKFIPQSVSRFLQNKKSAQPRHCFLNRPVPKQKPTQEEPSQKVIGFLVNYAVRQLRHAISKLDLLITALPSDSRSKEMQQLQRQKSFLEAVSQTPKCLSREILRQLQLFASSFNESAQLMTACVCLQLIHCYQES